MAFHGRTRIDFVASVPSEVIDQIEAAVAHIADDHGFYCYRHFDRVGGQDVLEISSHDRTVDSLVNDVSDETLVSFVKLLARSKGQTPVEYIDELVKKGK